MRSLGQNWVFSIYSAYNDDAYTDLLIKIDEYRIKVNKYNRNIMS